ncbi:MAG: hypothetical protein WKG32_12415 [Gemmatimonadaceae bacterium]
MRPLTAVLAVVLALPACGDLTTPTGGPGIERPNLALSTPNDSLAAANSGPQLLVCPTVEDHVERALVGPLGGTLGVRGTSISIPPGAVPEPTLFEIAVPASRFMEVEIHAVASSSYLFRQPATITINYARCPDDAAPPAAVLQGVYIDGAKRVLETMPGNADKVAKKMSFQTNHLSGYAVAY